MVLIYQRNLFQWPCFLPNTYSIRIAIQNCCIAIYCNTVMVHNTQPYKALVAPQLEFAVAVWQIGNGVCLEKIQRKGSAMCLGIPGTAGLEAVEVEAGVKPLELRWEELAIRQAGRIGDDECIKISWDSFLDQEETEQKISPFGKMNTQVVDMLSNTGLTLNGLEKEFNYLDSLQFSKQRPEYWQGLGSSKSRKGEQEKLSREIIGGFIDKCDVGKAVVFADGSCLGNPGPWRAGACVFPPGSSEPVMLKQPVSSTGSILLRELAGIKMALQYTVRCKTRGEEISKVHIFSDSQSTVVQLTLGCEANSHRTTVQEETREIRKLEEKKVTVELSWLPGHADIKGNEHADKIAKEVAQEAKEVEQLPAVISLVMWNQLQRSQERKSGKTCGTSQIRAEICICLDQKWIIKSTIHMSLLQGKEFYLS